MKDLINKYSRILVIFGFLFINFWFYKNAYWKELAVDSSKNGVGLGEVTASEWGMEKIYEKIISGENPFSPIKDVLHPFGMDIAFSDPGMAFHFLIFRPFFSPHQSLAFYIILTTFLANIGMYLLLRSLKISKYISFLVGLSFGFMTFLLPRAGHLNYIASIFFFPWFYLFINKTISTVNKKYKLFFLFGTIFIFLMTLWQNFYYFIILLLSIFFLLCYFLIFQSKKLFQTVVDNWFYILLLFISILVLLVPQLKVVYETFKFSEPPMSTGWVGAIDFSADLLGFFVPSIYNYYYGNLLIYLIKDIGFAKNIFENFTYPGLIILSSLLFLFLYFKKFNEKMIETIKPFIWTCIGFFILTLGPFLHIAGYWWLQVENIKIVFPLPFIILHYIPFLGNIRAPGRLIVGFIFFAYLISAFVASEFLRNKSTKFKIIFFLVVLLVIIMDQRPTTVPLEAVRSMPVKIFNYVKKDTSNSSLLEIPFSLRDGFTYFGDYNSVVMTNGQLIHKKSIVGGYTGRIPDHTKEYYRQNAFLGYLGRVIDENLKDNPYMKNTDLTGWDHIDILSSLKAINFLDIKYIVLDEKRNFSKRIIPVISQLGYKKILTEDKFSLWIIDLKKIEFLEASIGKKGDELLLGLGWYDRESNFRWSRKKNSVMFKIVNKRNMTLHARMAPFYQPQKVTVYLNKKKLSEISLSSNIKEYIVPITKTDLIVGINTVHFIFDKNFMPSDIIPGSLDQRKISGQFYKIWLTD